MTRRLLAFTCACVLAPAIVQPSSAASTPYSGAPLALPGHIRAEDFDNGGAGSAYHDSSDGNAGGQYRQTSVDLEACATGGYNVGWIDAGEWLNYSVSAAEAGSYTVRLHVASPGGGSLHVGFDGPSHAWATVSVPATGGWQSWTTVTVPATLGAGDQLMTIYFDTAGINLDYIDVSSSGGATPLSLSAEAATPPSSPGGASVSVVTWNVKLDSAPSHAQQVIDYVMAMTPQPQVVVLQEALQSLYGTYVGELQARSGRTWSGVLNWSSVSSPAKPFCWLAKGTLCQAE
jgi:hypothetical protein